MIPSAKSCAPEKIAIIEARNGKPGTALPCDEVAHDHEHEQPTPKSVKAKPTRLAICSGTC